MLGTGGHQNLLGYGGQASPGETLGDGSAQFRQAVGMGAGSMRVLGQLRGDAVKSVAEQLLRQPGCGPGQVDRGIRGR
ncbi:hypothetical protein ACIBI9_60960 [Nonomuraea sp. NPDC050451]|uniref:hypothetical protein n=1 Tax=Nonomuraea sp. NPDC050451 TaxID=3364364 RepID=UPI0037A0AB38